MALSKIPDLTHSYKGQDYTFIDQLEVYLREIECPICHSIVSEPVITTCGHLFCEECHNKVRRQTNFYFYEGMCYEERTVKCPVCTQVHDTMGDKFNDRKVKKLKVRCINHIEGCEWVGCLGDEGQHRTKQDGCAYEEIPCAHGCSATIRRMNQQTHSVDCPMRPHKCDYCGDVGPYQCIIGDHLETCRRYPVQCPNGCKEKIPREEVLSESRLKEKLSALTKKLRAEERHARQLERDNKAKTECIHQLERDTTDKAQRIQYLQCDTQAMQETIAQLTEAKKRLMEEVSQSQAIIYTLVALLISGMLLVYLVFFK